jgi:hypothetical protein
MLSRPYRLYLTGLGANLQTITLYIKYADTGFFYLGGRTSR